MHPNEPSVEELKKRQAELWEMECTEEVEAKLKAIDNQIERRKVELKKQQKVANKKI